MFLQKLLALPPRWTDQMVHANDISFYYRLPADNRDLFPYVREVQSDDQYLLLLQINGSPFPDRFHYPRNDNQIPLL